MHDMATRPAKNCDDANNALALFGLVDKIRPMQTIAGYL